MTPIKLQTDEIVLKLNGKEIFVIRPRSILVSGDSIVIPELEVLDV